MTKTGSFDSGKKHVVYMIQDVICSSFRYIKYIFVNEQMIVLHVLQINTRLYLRFFTSRSILVRTGNVEERQVPDQTTPE